MKIVPTNLNILVAKIKDGILETSTECEFVVLSADPLGNYRAGDKVIAVPESVVPAAAMGKNIYLLREVDILATIEEDDEDESASNDLPDEKDGGEARTSLSDTGTTGNPGN